MLGVLCRRFLVLVFMSSADLGVSGPCIKCMTCTLHQLCLLLAALWLVRLQQIARSVLQEWFII